MRSRFMETFPFSEPAASPVVQTGALGWWQLLESTEQEIPGERMQTDPVLLAHHQDRRFLHEPIEMEAGRRTTGHGRAEFGVEVIENRDAREEIDQRLGQTL